MGMTWENGEPRWDGVEPQPVMTSSFAYVRLRDDALEVRYRGEFNLYASVHEGADAGIVLIVIQHEPQYYDIVRIDDRLTLDRLVRDYPSAVVTETEMLVIRNEAENRRFRQTWKSIP